MSELTKLTESMLDDAKTFAAELDVLPDIHQMDFIFQFLITHPGFGDKTGPVRYYFYDGQTSAQQLADLVAEFGYGAESKPRLLEFASGYGCVSRHFSNLLPHAQTVSCDIHQEAIDFLSGTLGRDAILSSPEPERLVAENDFDVVFALSFFSHMPKSTWLRWLQALYARVKPGGILAFTTQGIGSRVHFNNPEIPEDGFWFSATSEQKDLDENEYGQTIVTEDYVRAQMQFLPGAELVKYAHAFWWGHQDLYVIKRVR